MIICFLTYIIVVNSYTLKLTNNDVDLMNNTKISFNNTLTRQAATKDSGGSNGNVVYIGGGIGGLFALCLLYYCFCRR